MSSKRGRPRDIPFHPYAELFPLMHGRDFQELVDSIRETGHLVEDIVLHQGRVLDGRNRFRACRSAGVAPTFTVFGWPKNLPLPDFVVKACLACRMLTAEQMGRLPLGLVDVDRSFPVDGIAGDALAFVVAKNLPRRHLDESQRALIAAKVANMRQGARTDLRRSAEPVWPRGTGTIVPDPAGAGDVQAERGAEAPAEPTPGIPLPGAGRSGTEVPEPPANLPEVSQAEAADRLGVSERSLRTAKRVLEEGAPELVAAVEAGQASIAAAATIAALPKDEQVELLKKVAAEPDGRRALKEAAKQVRRGEQEQNHVAKQKRLAEISAHDPELPLGRTFPIVYIDVPRKPEAYDDVTGAEKSPDRHYPVMSFAELCDFPIDRFAAPEALILFWSTASSHVDDLEILAEWGFVAFRPRGPDGKLLRGADGAPLGRVGPGRYGSHQIWRKRRVGRQTGTGRWVWDQHELLVIARRGDAVPAPLPGTQPESVFDAEIGEHSAKPPDVRAWIERCWPHLAPYCELFGRGGPPSDKWVFWGNQAEPQEWQLPVDENGLVQVDPNRKVAAAFVTTAERELLRAAALHNSDLPHGGKNEAEPPPFVEDDIPAFLRRIPGKAETAAGAGVTASGAGRGGRAEQIVVDDNSNRGDAPDPELQILDAIDRGEPIAEDLVLRVAEQKLIRIRKGVPQLLAAGRNRLGEHRAAERKRLDLERRMAGLPDDLDELVRIYGVAIDAYDEAVRGGQAVYAGHAWSMMDDVVVKANGGTEIGSAVNDPPVQVRRRNRAPVGQVPKWGQEGAFVASAGGVTAIVEHDGKAFDIYAVRFNETFPRTTGFHSCGVGRSDFGGFGMTIAEYGRELILDCIEYAFGRGRHKNSGVPHHGLVYPERVYRLDAAGPQPIERGVIFDERSCPAGLDFDALHLFFDEWDAARHHTNPRGRTKSKFPRVRPGHDLVAAVVAGELVPVADYPVAGAYVVEHHLRSDKKDRKFRYVADGAALDADAPAAPDLAEAAE